MSIINKDDLEGLSVEDLKNKIKELSLEKNNYINELEKMEVSESIRIIYDKILELENPRKESELIAIRDAAPLADKNENMLDDIYNNGKTFRALI